ncbi:ANTAR domain-containing protein, partial [Nocardia sp. NPDC002869]|uniref:ANTAR domain-containing protein n=1 Tax=Nocardia sp. NPDC002869 TaxID=3161032 RepID=UPI00398C9AB5
SSGRGGVAFRAGTVDTRAVSREDGAVTEELPDSIGSVSQLCGEALQDTLPGLYAARAVIEQAKGALMVVYGLSADQAFRVLIRRSQETDTKLRELAAGWSPSCPRWTTPRLHCVPNSITCC